MIGLIDLILEEISYIYMKLFSPVQKLSLTLMVSVFALSACAPTPKQAAAPNTVNTPDNQQTAVLETDFILTQKSDGVENPITPERIQSIQIDGKTVSSSEIQIVKGDFATQQSGGDLQVQYVLDQNGNINVGVFRILSRLGAIGKVTVTYLDGDQSKTFSFSANANQTGAGKKQNLRLTVQADGTLVGGVAAADGTLDKDKPVFRTTAEQKLEVLSPDGSIEVFDLTQGQFDAPQKQTQTGNERDELLKEVGSISTINLFVGNWFADLLGKKIKIKVRDGGGGSINGTASLDGKSYSAKGTYEVSASQPNNLALKGSAAGSADVSFDVKLSGANSMTLTLTDANGETVLEPLVGLSFSLNRGL